jgi:dienelactone hydrolase
MRKKQGFGKSNQVAVTGFCFGGRCALMFAATYPNEVRAVVPFYGNLKTPAFAGRKLDPIDVVASIRVPVQGHYAENASDDLPFVCVAPAVDASQSFVSERHLT